MPVATPPSFIPKQALKQQDLRPSKQPVGLLFVIDFIVLLVSGIVLGGALLYHSLLRAEIEAPCAVGEGSARRCGLRASVEAERKNIDQLTIESLQRLDQKLAITDELLAKHNSILAVFKLLEENTLRTIGYTSFNFDETEGKIQMDGLATSFEDIAVQSDVWNEVQRQRQIKSFIFSDLNQQTGLSTGLDRIQFKLTLVIEPSVVLATNQSL